MSMLKILMFTVSMVVLFTLTGCQGSNSETTVLVEIADDNETVTTVIKVDTEDNTTAELEATLVLSVTESEVTINNETLQINVKVIDGFNNPFTTGSIKIIYPNDVREARDVGSFVSSEIALGENGIATFTYTAPDSLENNTSNIYFGFYHDSKPSSVKEYSIKISPVKDQIILTSYNLSSSPDLNVSVSLNSSLLMSFFINDSSGKLIDDLSVESINIESLNHSLGTLTDTLGNSGNTITYSNKNNITVRINTNTLSGIIPLKATVIFNDVNNISITIVKIFNVVVLSGPPTAISMNYKGSSHEGSKFKDILVVSLTDEYGNLVNTNPGLSVELISGYAKDSAGPLGYMYHRHDEPIAGILEADKFKVESGVATKIDITNRGSNYSFAPLVSLAGGDGTFKAKAILNTIGAISEVKLIDNGYGYTEAPNIQVIGEGGGFVGKVNLATVGGFKEIILDNPGLGYTSIPTITANGGGTDFNADVTLESTGSIRTITINNGGSGYAVGDQLTVQGDGLNAIVKVTKVDINSAGKITEITIFNKGNGYIAGNTTIDATATGNGDAELTVSIGYAIESITLIESGTGYSNNSLTINGGSPISEAVASGNLSYALDSVTVLSGGYGYSYPTIKFDGDGKDAYAYPIIRYSVNSIDIENGGTGYTDSDLIITTVSEDTGSGAAANIIVFNGSDLANADEDNYKLALFGNGYVYNASGKWDFTHLNTLSDYELTMKDSFDGNKTTNLGFAIGNNYRQDQCMSGVEWIVTAKTVSGTNFDSSGIAEIELTYDHYMVGKDIVVMVNIVGAQNSLDKNMKLGEARKHTLRGGGISATTISFPKGTTYDWYETEIKMDETIDYLRNSNFGFTIKVAGDDVEIHEVKTSMDDGVRGCKDSWNNDTEGRSYVKFLVSSPTAAGSIVLEDLIISREFN